ncbi:MAG: disulfide bond formation protein B [Dechloromonas sp.]|jgi:disulfide bond formation protein DsbB|nr:disulfide bond formation protein B [Dechloromonas sp.]
MPWREVPVRAWFAALALGAFGAVAGGMELQNLVRLAPCPLCIFQRLVYMVIGLVALLGAIAPAGRLLWSALIAGLAAGGMAVAGYQSWMQAFPHLATECSYSDPNAIERLVDWLGMAWPSLFLATGFCTGRDWEFLGLSLANWSLLISAGIAGYAALLFVRRG